MGLFFSRIATALSQFNSEPARILMLGLDAAGKTTILYKIKLNEVVATIPTIGFNVETVSPVKGISFTVWDVGGQDKIRALWRHYYQNVDGLLFIVDSADHSRISEAKDELYGILDSDEMRKVPVLVVANKQDLPGAMKPHEVVERLELHKLINRKWFIQAACAQTGDGIYESMTELAKLVKDFKKGRY